MTMAVTTTDPTSLYVSVCRYVLSDSGLEDLYRMLPYLKQALSCCVCENLLKDPYGPRGTPCHHYVCRTCLGGRKVLRPPCGWCVEYHDFVPCRQLHILLNCYRKLCEYVACTSSGRSLLSANGASSSVLTSLQEGLMLPCDTTIPDRDMAVLTAAGRGHTGPPGHRPQSVRGRGSHRVRRHWRRGGRGRGSRGGLGRGFHHQRRSIISITPHGNRWRQRGVATRGTRHQVISREIRNLAGWGSFHQLELDDKPEEPEVEDNVSVASNSPPVKRACRCGTFCEPNQLTCRRQRCRCYSNQLSCAGCHCRGCKNPYTDDDIKKEGTETE